MFFLSLLYTYYYFPVFDVFICHIFHPICLQKLRLKAIEKFCIGRMITEQCQ